jgi:hypothetical protein
MAAWMSVLLCINTEQSNSLQLTHHIYLRYILILYCKVTNFFLVFSVIRNSSVITNKNIDMYITVMSCTSYVNLYSSLLNVQQRCHFLTRKNNSNKFQKSLHFTEYYWEDRIKLNKKRGQNQRQNYPAGQKYCYGNCPCRTTVNGHITVRAKPQ